MMEMLQQQQQEIAELRREKTSITDHIAELLQRQHQLDCIFYCSELLILTDTVSQWLSGKALDL